MPKLHLTQPGFTYSACGTFTQKKERIKDLNKQEIQDTYLSKRIRSSLFTTWYGLWSF